MNPKDRAGIVEACTELVMSLNHCSDNHEYDRSVRHLHAFVREVRPNFDEWGRAIAFLTETGQMCDDKRQEFILLSDTLGVSMLVDAINHQMPQGATETTVLGPFFVADAPELPLGADISPDVEGEPMFVSGTVTTPDGKPIAGAIVDTWHSDDDGHYDVQQLDELRHLSMRARFRTDAGGRFHFRTIKAAAYPIPVDGPVGKMLEAQGRHPWRPAHVHFMVAAPGFVPLVTHVFEAGDSYLDSDAVFGVKDSLIAPWHRHPAGKAPDGTAVERPFYTLDYAFGLKPA